MTGWSVISHHRFQQVALQPHPPAPHGHRHEAQRLVVVARVFHQLEPPPVVHQDAEATACLFADLAADVVLHDPPEPVEGRPPLPGSRLPAAAPAHAQGVVAHGVRSPVSARAGRAHLLPVGRRAVLFRSVVQWGRSESNALLPRHTCFAWGPQLSPDSARLWGLPVTVPAAPPSGRPGILADRRGLRLGLCATRGRTSLGRWCRAPGRERRRYDRRSRGGRSCTCLPSSQRGFPPSGHSVRDDDVRSPTMRKSKEWLFTWFTFTLLCLVPSARVGWDCLAGHCARHAAAGTSGRFARYRSSTRRVSTGHNRDDERSRFCRFLTATPTHRYAW